MIEHFLSNSRVYLFWALNTKRKVAQAAFSFCTLHYYLFTLHFSLNFPERLFQRRDKREERKEKVAFLPLVEKHFYYKIVCIFFGTSTQKEKSRKRLFLFVLFTIIFSLFTFL